MNSTRSPVQWWYGVQQLREQLHRGHKVRWMPGGTGADGVKTLSWPTYEDWLWGGIWDGIHYLCDHLGADWRTHYDNLTAEAMSEIPNASIDELAAWFTLYGNRERIVEGLISGGVDDGSILAMADRLLELVPKP